MAIYRQPNVYFTENIQSIGSTAFGFNRTAVIGPAQLYTKVSNLEMVKSTAVTSKTSIVLANVKPVLEEFVPAVGSFTIWTETTAPDTGKIELDLVKAHWIGNLTPSIGDFVILVDDAEAYGYKESTEGATGALQIIATIEGNGFASSTEGTEGALEIIATPDIDVDKILLPNGTAASKGFVPAVGDYVKLVSGSYIKVESTTEDALEVVADSATPTATQIKLSDVTPTLPKQDIFEVIGIGNIPGYNNYVKGTDYTIDAYNTKITWLTLNKPANGSTFYITYNINKTEENGDFEPKLMFNQSAIKEVYGPEYNNGVIQPLTLAADLVLEGQTLLGGGVYCVQVTADTDVAYKAAIDKLNKINVQTVIILKQDSLSLRNYLIQAIETCSSDLYGKERTTFIVPNDLTLSVDAMVAQREGLKNSRITYFCNKQVTVALTDESTQEEENIPLSAIYACCNLSGIEGNPDYGYSEPMLRKTLSSRITLVDNQIFDPSERNYYCSNFLSAFDFNENTNLTQVFDIYTTDDTNVITESRSVRRVTDLLRTDLRKQLASYIGQKTTNATASSAQVRTQSILQNYVSAEEIKDYANVASSFDKNNPKQLNISFDFIPLFETKYVHVTLGINI